MYGQGQRQDFMRKMMKFQKNAIAFTANEPKYGENSGNFVFDHA